MFCRFLTLCLKSGLIWFIGVKNRVKYTQNHVKSGEKSGWDFHSLEIDRSLILLLVVEVLVVVSACIMFTFWQVLTVAVACVGEC